MENEIPRVNHLERPGALIPRQLPLRPRVAPAPIAVAGAGSGRGPGWTALILRRDRGCIKKMHSVCPRVRQLTFLSDLRDSSFVAEIGK